MSASDRATPTASAFARSGIAVLLLLAGACDDPTRPLQAPAVSALRLLLILDPDAGAQPLLIQHAGRGEVVGAHATIRDGDQSPLAAAADEQYSCNERYGAIVQRPHCFTFALIPQPGATYTVSAMAEGVPTATATTTVPGDFRLVSFTSSGAAPDPGTITATWTRSAGTHRYVVAIRGTPTENCHPDSVCNDRWYAVTSDTSLSADVDSRFFERSRGPYSFDVYAMNRNAYEYVMTGSGSSLFPVPPGQNVQGGYGGVGAWVRRSVPLR